MVLALDAIGLLTRRLEESHRGTIRSPEEQEVASAGRSAEQEGARQASRCKEEGDQDDDDDQSLEEEDHSMIDFDGN
jgi:hypothetical protein